MMNEIVKGNLIVDSRHGVYCPQVFAERIARELFPSISEEAWSILEEGPEAEHYWDVWDYEVEGQTSINGGTIYQDGDVWIIYEWSEEE